MQGLESKVFSRGAELSHKTTTYIPAEYNLRPLRDHIIAKPLDNAFSALIIVINESKPIRLEVLAIGPGVYPLRYDHNEKHKRTKCWWSKALRRCDVKVGDVISVEDFERQTIYWGNAICVILREEDVRFIEQKEAAGETITYRRAEHYVMDEFP